MESRKSRLFNKIKDRISRLLNKEQGEIENQESLQQESWTDELRDLAPIDNVENFDTYEQTLNWAFQNERVKNIALSGPYGSGKSSIIESYLKNHTDVKSAALKISLASFTSIDTQVDSSQDDVETKIQIDEEEIERGILKQLFYAANPESIPQTCYRRLRPKGIFNYLRVFLIIMTLIVFGLASVNADIKHNILDVIGSFFHQEIKKESSAEFAELLLISAAIAGAVLLLFKNQLVKFRLGSLNLFSNLTITDKTNEEESVFNQKLDEIMYFFETMKYDTVFFEDLDRLNNPIIFVHLRELNQLLNNDQLIGRKPIRFVYAVRDDIFLAEDRTKFFDFIIPVIPVTSSENSGGEFLTHIENIAKTKDGTITDDLRRFIVDIGPFIPDMRTLINTCNEFSIYRNLLKEKLVTNSDVQRLLAMLIFKTSCPSDFADIRNGKGELCGLFTHGDDIIREMKERIRNQCAEEGMEESKYEELVNQLDDMNVKQIFEAKELRRFLPKEFQENKLLIFMLRRGYINGSYMKYISYFKEGGITLADERFILSVKNQEPLEPNYKIDNVERVAQQLLIIDYREEAARNYNLFDYLLSNDGNQDWNPKPVFYSKNKRKDERLEALILNLARWASESNEWKSFFDGFKSKYKWKLIVLLATKWDKMLCCILGGEIYKDYTGRKLKKGLIRESDSCDFGILFSDKDKEYYIEQILEKCSVDVIQSQINEVNNDWTYLLDDLHQFLDEHKDILDESVTGDSDIDEEIDNHHDKVWDILGYTPESDQ